MLALIGSFISGGFFGLIGSIFKQVMAYKQEQLAAEERGKDRQFELDKMDKDRESMLAEAQANIQIMETETRGAIAVETLRADSAAFTTSFANDKAAYAGEEIRKTSKAMLFVDFCRGMARPGITFLMVLMLFAMVGGIGYCLWAMKESIELALSLSSGTAYGLAVVTKLLALMEMLILLTSNLAATCIGWWFGDRNAMGKELAQKLMVR